MHLLILILYLVLHLVYILEMGYNRKPKYKIERARNNISKVLLNYHLSQ